MGGVTLIVCFYPLPLWLAIVSDGCITPPLTPDGRGGVIPMDVAEELAAVDREDGAGELDELLATPSRKRGREGAAQRPSKPGAVQIVASMVDRALQVHVMRPRNLKRGYIMSIAAVGGMARREKRTRRNVAGQHAPP